MLWIFDASFGPTFTKKSLNLSEMSCELVIVLFLSSLNLHCGDFLLPSMLKRYQAEVVKTPWRGCGDDDDDDGDDGDGGKDDIGSYAQRNSKQNLATDVENGGKKELKTTRSDR